ncbi:MAG: hypothetical protein M3M93_00345 [Actinomycetota bacterium]|nr:hypothetical protein [Actinomycetota bacterium]
MAQWPKTVRGKLFYVALAAVVVPLLVWFVATLPSLFLWAIAGVALASVALYAWRRRVESARERAWVGEFSFGDVVRRRRAEEALEVAAH